MGNIVITNNGSATGTPEIPSDPDNGIQYQAATPSDPAITITLKSGQQIVLAPGECTGVAYSTVGTIE